MHKLSQLEKQQVGLRLPKYLIDEIDEFTKMFSINRTDVIIEAIKSYISEQKAEMLYERFDRSCKEAKEMMEGRRTETTLRDLIDELETDTDS